MAIVHFQFKTGSRGRGQSAVKQFQYISREAKYERDDLEYVEHQNYPDWASSSPCDFWKAADQYERANGRLYTELVFALPRELNQEQRLSLVKGFVEQEIGKSHPYTIAIHNPRSLDGKSNPHAHIIFTERKLDGIKRSPERFFKRFNGHHPTRGGAGKDRDWSRQSKVEELRKSWTDTLNLGLKKAGYDLQLDHRSLKQQGINRPAEPKLGTVKTTLLKRGIETTTSAHIMMLREYRSKEKDLNKLKEEINRFKDRYVVRVKASEIRDKVREERNSLYQRLDEIQKQRFDS